MVSVGCRIHTHPARTDPGLVERFRNIPVANLDDCMGRTAALSSAIRPYGPRRLLGQAFTVRVPAGDNLMFHKAMDMAQPGDVFVIDAFGCEERSILGELMVSYCKIRGASGIVVDGCIRDADAIRAMNFPLSLNTAHASFAISDKIKAAWESPIRLPWRHKGLP